MMMPPSFMTMHRAAIFAVVALFLLAVPARAAITIESVTSDKGITAWLVEDYAVPLVTIQFAFRGGSTQDPAGKEGLANLMTGLFDEGAGDLDSEAFQERLDDVGAEMRFNAARDAVYGSMRLLADDKDEAFAVLKLAINEPRFDAAPIERIREQVVAGIRSRERDPDAIAAIQWNEAIYGDHPYARRDSGTEATLRTITADDLHAQHKALFARDNLVVGVVGAIDAEALKTVLDDLFGDLPEQADLEPVSKVVPKLDQTMHVAFDQPQTRIRLAYPGVPRSAPEFFPAYLMNHILGGGTFTSRLYEAVREERGLAYGVGSYIAPRDYSTALIISTATRADRAGETLRIVRDEVRRMAEKGPSDAELAAAKRYVKGSYAINNLTNSRSIARVLVQMQMEDLGIDYIDAREAAIDAVTLEETRAEAARLLSADPAIMLVGPNAIGGEGDTGNETRETE